jgi:hypothetical protein
VHDVDQDHVAVGGRARALAAPRERAACRRAGRIAGRRSGDRGRRLAPGARVLDAVIRLSAPRSDQRYADNLPAARRLSLPTLNVSSRDAP